MARTVNFSPGRIHFVENNYLARIGIFRIKPPLCIFLARNAQLYKRFCNKVHSLDFEQSEIDVSARAMFQCC